MRNAARMAPAACRPQVLGLSGILALFCCGAAVSHYVLRGAFATSSLANPAPVTAAATGGPGTAPVDDGVGVGVRRGASEDGGGGAMGRGLIGGTGRGG